MAKCKKLLALLLTLATLLSMVPVTALAAETEEVPTEVVETGEEALPETETVDEEFVEGEEPAGEEPAEAEEPAGEEPAEAEEPAGEEPAEAEEPAGEEPATAEESVGEEPVQEKAVAEETALYEEEGIAVAALTSDTGTCGANLYWTLSSNGTMVITGTGVIEKNSNTWREHEDDVTLLRISSGVTGIGDYAFDGFDSVTKVELPSTLTSIGRYAFNSCNALNTISIPESVTSIGDGAFSSCESLTSINIPSKVTSIGVYAFYQCRSLTTVTIPASSVLTEVKENAFYNCVSLKTITLPSKLTKMGTGVFRYCSSLTQMTIPDSVTDLGEMMFYFCSSLQTVTLPKRLTSIPYGTFSGCEKLGEIAIPYAVASIENNAFSYCSSLKTVKIPAAVTTVKYGAFSNCTALTDVYYEGSRQNWAAINVAGSNTYLTGATIHFGSYTPEKPVVLATPQLTRVSNMDGSVRVAWSAVTGAAKYQVWRKTSGSSWSKVGGAVTGTSYYDLSVESGVTYTYTVSCVSADGKTAASDYDTTGLSILYLEPPTVTVSNTADNKIKVSWNQVAGAGAYVIRYKVGNAAAWTTNRTVISGATSVTISGGTQGAKYTYTVVAKSGSTESYVRTASIVKLNCPALTSAKNTTGGITVTWSKVAGAASYDLYYKVKGSTANWKKIKTGLTGTSCTLGGGTSGKTYIYTVRAVSGSTMSSYVASGISVLKLSTPAVTLKNASGGVTVSWNKIGGASGYYVYRKSGTSGYTKIATIKSGSTVSYADTSVKSKNGTAYRYAVRAYYGSTLSAYVDKGIVRLTTPTLSSVTNSASRSMTVKWTKNTAATGYQVYYKTGSTGKTVTVPGNANLSKVISGLTKGNTYGVCVRSYRTLAGTNYYSGWSGAKSVKISK